MKSPLLRWLLPGIALFFSGIEAVRGDMVAGVDEYVSKAHTIVSVRAQTAREAAAFPPPEGRQRVVVLELLKGIDARQEFLVKKNSLEPGGFGIVLLEYEYKAMAPTDPADGEAPTVWAMDAKEMVNTKNVPEKSTEGGELFGSKKETVLPLGSIRADIHASSPEETGLYGEVIDALFRPGKFKTSAEKDAARATYVRFVIAVHDLERDVAFLAQLLESPEREIRAASEARLEALTGAKIPAPADDTPLALSEWSAKWAEQKLPAKTPVWPPVPVDPKAEPGTFPAALVKAVDDVDAAAFAREFAAWLDSGGVRDRQIAFAKKTLPDESKGEAFFEPDGKPPERPDPQYERDNLVKMLFSSGYMVPAPRLPVDLVMNPKVPAGQRVEYMALLAERLHWHRFRLDRIARTSFLMGQKPGSETVKRAAYWERSRETDEYDRKNPRSVALEKIAEHPESARAFMALYLTPSADRGGEQAPTAEALEAVETAIAAGNKEFVALLVEYIKTHHDLPATQGARVLCQRHMAAVLPVMIEWLGSGDRMVRLAAAGNLWSYPSKQTTPALLAAIHAETGKPPIPPEVESDGPIIPRLDMLMALALNGDPRGGDVLLDAVVNDPMPGYRRGDLINGLSRMGDKKALPALAKIVRDLEWVAGKNIPKAREKEAQEKEIVLYTAVLAYAYIKTRDEDYRPWDEVGENSADMQYLRATLARVKKWEKGK